MSGDTATRLMIAKGLGQLTEWAATTAKSESALPAHVLDKSALVLVDDLAAMIAASNEPEVRALLEQTRVTPSGEATVFIAKSGKAARRDAAFINGVAGCWCELDEGFRGAPAHAGIYVLPVLLAEADARGAVLRDLLRWLAVAYEVTARLAECWRFAQATWHPHAAMAGMGAAVAAALAAGVPGVVLRRALSIAGGLVPAGGYDAAIEGALVRNLWTGQAALTGIQAVDWAQAGLDGFADGPHQAFTNLFACSANPAALAANLGQRWAIRGCYHKLHGCCHSTHCAVEAALELRPKVAADLHRIELIKIYTHRPSMSNPAPANPLAARFSFEHVVSSVLVHGHAGPAAFTRSAIDNATVTHLRPRVMLKAYPDQLPWPHDRAAMLEITLKGGTSFTATCLSAPGGADNPIDVSALLTKCEAVAGRALPGFTAAASRLLEGAWRDDPWRLVAARLTMKV
jgi:2-methylcitrate dehydratase PrpD